MNIIAWIVLILNVTAAVLSFMLIFIGETVTERIKNAFQICINGMTIYLVLYILGFIK